MSTQERTNDDNTVEIRLDDTNLDPSSITLAVADAIASLKNINSQDLEPVYYSIESEALETLIQNATTKDQSALNVTFAHAGCRITIKTDPHLAVSATRQ